MKLQTNNWKEFNLKELGFNIYHGKRITKHQRDDGDIPLLTAGKLNQGVAQYISKPLCLYEDAITVDMFGNCFFHKGRYSGDDNIYFFTNKDLSENIKLYLSSTIAAKLRDKYNFKEQFRQNDADNLSIFLPTSNGNPDYAYMEEYISERRTIVSSQIDELLSVKNEKIKADTQKWEKIKLNEIVDSYNIAKSFDFGKLQTGQTVFVNRSNKNNGIQGFVDTKSSESKNCITIGMVGNSKHAFWQSSDFAASQNILVLRNKKWNVYSGLFICSIINNMLKDLCNYKEVLKKTNS